MSLTDITGTFLRILLNYRDKDAPPPNDPKDHQIPTASLLPMLQIPLNQTIDQFWSGAKDSNNKTLRDLTQDEVVTKIKASPGTINVVGSFPTTGSLEAGVGPASFDAGAIVGNLFLVYALPGETFTFDNGLGFLSWRLNFDTELDILINVPEQPGLPLTANAKVKVSNASLSATNFAATVAEGLASSLLG